MTSKKQDEEILKNMNPEKEFFKTFKKLSYHHSPWRVWQDFVTMFSCSISNSLDKQHYNEREATYLKIINTYEKREQNMFPELVAQTVLALEKNPEQDFLGKLFMDLGLGNDSNGQFFTPYHVCELMSAVTLNDIVSQVKKDGYICINDCACGAGATLIAAINEAKRQLEKEKMNFQNHVLIVAQDIDMTVALMCYIQLSLLGVAGYVKVGNSITEPIATNDSTENYWFTPMYFSEVWTMRRAVRAMDNILKGEKHEF